MDAFLVAYDTRGREGSADAVVNQP